MKASYRNQTGKYQMAFDELATLMPGVGTAETVAGELIRSATRLAYDFYNNGMGNNTSGPANFLHNNNAINTETFDTIYYWTRGRIYDGKYNGDSLHVAIESMIDQTVEYILKNPDLKTKSNDEDMFEFGDPDQTFCEECGDDMEEAGYGWNGLCTDCAEHAEEEERREEEENTCEGCDVDLRYSECECEEDED